VEENRREKLISRLKKCLALSASPEPHEAAAALRQAQKLMRELDLTEADLLGLELADALVKTREGFGACRTMNFLTSIVMEAFGVQCIYERNPGTANRLERPVRSARATASCSPSTPTGSSGGPCRARGTPS